MSSISISYGAPKEETYGSYADWICNRGIYGSYVQWLEATSKRPKETTQEEEDDLSEHYLWDKAQPEVNPSVSPSGEQEPDPVHNPPHYNTGAIECIEYLKDNLTKEGFKGYLEGNWKKYGHRFKYKGRALEDLYKSQWYLTYLIEAMEQEQKEQS